MLYLPSQFIDRRMEQIQWKISNETNEKSKSIAQVVVLFKQDFIIPEM